MAGFSLSNLTSYLKNFNLSFLATRNPSVVGVDVGSSAIKVVQLKKRRGVATLETYGEIALGPYADGEIGQATHLAADKIGNALSDVLRESGITSSVAGFSIPFTSSLVTMVSMPAVNRKQLAKMIPYEARKYIPVPIAEVSLDWFVVPEAGGSFSAEEGKEDSVRKKTEVLLVAIHNDVLKKQQQIVEAANLTSDFFEIEVFSSARAVLRQTLAPVVVMDMGAATTKLYVVELGVPKVSYLIQRGGQDVTLAISRALGMSVSAAEELKREKGMSDDPSDENVKEAILLVLDHILSEANRVLLSYQKRYNKNVSRAVLTGGGAVLKGLLPVAQDRLETEVELGKPFSKIEAPAFLEDVLTEVGPEFSVAIGLALRRLQES